MLNPRLIHWSGPYETEEGCLSLPGMRPAKRFERVTVGYDGELMFHKVTWKHCHECLHGLR